jgi:hypothetical protein
VFLEVPWATEYNFHTDCFCNGSKKDRWQD